MTDSQTEADKNILIRALKKLDPTTYLCGNSTFGTIILAIFVLAVYLLVYVLIGLAPKKYGFAYPFNTVLIISLVALAQFAGFVLLVFYARGYQGSFGTKVMLYLGTFVLLLAPIVYHSILLYGNINNGTVTNNPYVNVALTSSVTLTFTSLILGILV